MKASGGRVIVLRPKNSILCSNNREPKLNARTEAQLAGHLPGPRPSAPTRQYAVGHTYFRDGVGVAALPSGNFVVELSERRERSKAARVGTGTVHPVCMVVSSIRSACRSTRGSVSTVSTV